MDYTQEELIDMVYALGEGERNPLLASRIYAQRFPLCRHPTQKSFNKLKQRFERTGGVRYEKSEREKPSTNEENEFLVLTSVVENPHASTREISNEVGISQSSVSKIFRRNKFHPYHVQLT